LGIKVELRQIRYFRQVATELSFTRAAQSLHMAQPPLSRQIKLLEEELGVDLFERVGRGIRLTDAGRYFLDQTENLTQKLEEIIKATQRIGRKDKRWFGLGFVPSTLYGFMPQFISRLRQLDNQVDIGLIEMTTLQQFDALKTGRIDVGVGRIMLHDDEVERLILRDERIVVALPAHHPLANRAALALREALSVPLILYPARPRPSYADHLLDLFRTKGHTPRVIQEVNELQTAIGLVAAGVGAALVPESVRGLHRADVAYVDLDEADFTSPVMLSWRRNDDSVFLKSVVSLARAMASDN
jgi:DNA-binding transcriptional LysR family regulator